MMTTEITTADRIVATYKTLNGFEANGEWTSLAEIFEYLNNGPAVTLNNFLLALDLLQRYNHSRIHLAPHHISIT